MRLGRGHYALWTLQTPGQPHLATCHRRLAGGILPHRFSGNISTLHPPVRPLKDVLVHALQCLPEREALVMVECAFGRGDIDLDFLCRLLPGPRNGRARVGFHLNKPQFKNDIRRNNVGAATGYRVLRYLYEDVLYRPEEMLEQIRLTLTTPPRMPC
ncbi:hypothetical protein [Arthrobacter globiformis]|uniref:Uncharacterized protein n=1 Tax=Arthrobacter globiformis TaxID=1665 RepID=A0A328HIB3_ARTGO|nr:hypothetical protein [Arthrobacter globiformis]RAM37871.1 hypothetical protein DBZ45_06985 [Arthrobacter globiformis]